LGSANHHAGNFNWVRRPYVDPPNNQFADRSNCLCRALSNRFTIYTYKISPEFTRNNLMFVGTGFAEILG